MPLFDFVCDGCQHRFEDLVKASETPACPRCASKAVLRQLPLFAVQGGAGSGPSMADMPPQGCGTCGDPRGPGSCSS